MTKKIIIAVVIAIVITMIIKRKTVVDVAKTIYDKLTRSQYIEMFSNAVRNANKGTGLFPSVAMAQGILESSNGNSGLTKKANNHFGIKADKTWLGKKMNFPTREVIGGKELMVDAFFRAYNNAEESYKDRVKFLKGFSRYKNVFLAGTPEIQAQALQNAGYATDPKYAELLIGIIKSNNLKELDA